MDWAKEFLLQSGDTLIGVIIGGVIVVSGQLIAARASRISADQSASASRDVAEVGNQTARLELRLKQTELVLDRQLATAGQFLDKLEAWETATRDIFKLGHDEAKIPPKFFDGYVGMQRWEAQKILRDMRLVLPAPVTSAAESALDAGLSALEKHEANFYTRGEDDKERRNHTENNRVEALDSFSRMRDKFLEALQKHFQLENRD